MHYEKKKIKDIEQKILAEVRPSQEEEAKLKKFIRELVTVAKIKSVKDVVVCGSIGKGDWHAGNHDIDVFILFPKKTKRDVLEDDGLLYGKQIAHELKGEAVMKFAEHPYIKASIRGYNVDIVPAYKIEEGDKIISAVDRSPLHLKYILGKFNDKLRDETRLLKQFMRGIGVYGSDVKTQGFSGYACELLVLKYGSFERAVQSIRKWHAVQIIAMKGKPNKKRIEKQFKDQPLVVVDPVDKDRNVTAIVSPENFMRLVKKAKQFLDEPTTDFFHTPESQPLTHGQLETLHERKTKFFALEITKPKDILEDTLYPQLRRAMRRIASLMKTNEFIAMRHMLSDDIDSKMYMIFEMEVWELPAVKRMAGPFIESQKHAAEFLKKYNPDKGFVPYVEGKIWFVDKKREFVEAVKCVSDFLSQDAKEMVEQGIPQNIVSVMFQSKLLEHEEFWHLVRQNKEMSDFMRRNYFETSA